MYHRAVVPIHRVAQGEFVAKIAARYGVGAASIWDHPDNRDLKDRRKSPHILKPGDSLFVPEQERREVEAATGKLHRFKVKLATTTLRVRFHLEDDARSEVPFVANVQGAEIEGTLDGDGALELTVPVDTPFIDVELRPEDEPPMRFRLDVGHLDPADDPGGVAQRLRHLGYDWDAGGAADGLGEEGARLLAGFQKKHGLDPTGQIDDAVRDKLRDVHGS